MRLCPAALVAGMPSLTLRDVAALRLETISFFLVVFLGSAWVVQMLWNSLRKDFAALPRLAYCKALLLTTLWGLLFVLVLTMISGARELMTPGAWEKQGLTYRLPTPPSTPAPPSSPSGPVASERGEKLRQLRESLWAYASTHEGRFPPNRSDAGIPPDRWLAPGAAPTSYLYVPGQNKGGGEVPLAYEPDAFGEERLVLFANGDILPTPRAELLKMLPPGGSDP